MKIVPLLLQKFCLQIGTTNPGIYQNHNLTMPPSLTLPTLSNSNTSNYIHITLNRHILHTSFTKLSILKQRDSKQSSSLSSPREKAGDVESNELDWEKTILGSWLCIMYCTIWRYSSSVLAEGKRAAV